MSLRLLEYRTLGHAVHERGWEHDVECRGRDIYKVR